MAVKGLPDEVLRKLASDPDFNSLDESGQDRIVSRFAQESYKQVDKPQNILQRAASAIRPMVGPSWQALGHGINNAAFTLPGIVMDKTLPQGAKDYLKPQGLGEQAGAIAGDLGGFMLGGPEQLVAKGAEKLLPKGIGMGASFIRGAGKGAAAMGSLEAPQVMAGNENPLMGAAKTAGGGLLQGAIEGIAPLAKSVFNPSKAFGKSMQAMEKAAPDARVDFSQAISDATDDPMAKKFIEKSGVLEKYGGITLGEGGAPSDNLANLSLEDSQNLVNEVKSLVRQGVKEGVIKPNEIGLAKMFKSFVDAQDAVFPQAKAARGLYGLSKNIGKGVKRTKNAAITGAVLGTTGTLGHSFVSGLLKK